MSRSAALAHFSGMKTYSCSWCSRKWERVPTKGQAPKYCPECAAEGNHNRRRVPCWVCGAVCVKNCGRVSSGRVTCSLACRSACILGLGYYPCRTDFEKAQRPAYTPQTGLRQLFEAGRYDEALDSIVARATPVGECLEINGKPYPVVRWTNTQKRAAHRLVLEAKVKRPIDGWHAHHTCANAACVNPDHIEPATARANIGEMLARRTYEAEIEALRAALAEVAPSHPLLRGSLVP